MKILSFIHQYPPYHNAGAEYMLHEMNKYFIEQGHEAKVMIRQMHGTVPYMKNGMTHSREVEMVDNFEGVEIHMEGVIMYNKLFDWADVVITHLDRTGKAINLCRNHEKKLIHLIHNTRFNSMIVDVNGKNQSCIYNADWVGADLNYKMQSCVFHPAVNYKDYQVEVTGDFITLMNCFGPKGGQILIDIAKAMPDRNFIGMMGYGNQVVGTEKNIMYLDNTADARAIYAKSRIVIMPSEYESFGRVAIEASASGIPVVCSTTPGLHESLGWGEKKKGAGVFIKNLSDISEWVAAIEKLDDPEYYKEIGDKGIKRAKEITKQSKPELVNMLKFVDKIRRERYYGE